MSAPPRTLSLAILPLASQHYSCHGCGNCCRDFTVQLRRDDLDKLRQQHWDERLSEPVTVEFRGKQYLRQRADGACVFLLPDGKCRIHAEFGLEAKPLACQLFPFVFAPDQERTRVGLSFACQSVLANKGAALASHLREVTRMSAAVPELVSSPPSLDDKLTAEPLEVSAFADALDRWLRQTDTPIAIRLDGMAWLAQQLSRARFASVREQRFKDLVDLLVTSLPTELPFHPVEPATGAQMATLRQAVFFRLEDPKIGDLKARGKLRTVWDQFRHSRAFAKGRGMLPPVGDQWPRGATFEAVARVASPIGGEAGSAVSTDAAAIDDLFTRWLRATVLGGRAWGSGFYGWSMVRGLQAISLNAACALWLTRAHAAARGRQVPTLEDAQAAVGRVDRASGRAPWLGSRAESLRLRFLCIDDGLRRVMRPLPSAP